MTERERAIAQLAQAVLHLVNGSDFRNHPMTEAEGESAAIFLMPSIDLLIMRSTTELATALRGLLEIEEARIATGAFSPNAVAAARIDAARTALTQQVSA